MDAEGRKLGILIAAASLLLILEGGLILMAATPKSSTERSPGSLGGGAAFRSALRDPGTAGRLAAPREALEIEKIGHLSPREAHQAGISWARAAHETRPIASKDIESILPTAPFFLARTSSESDVEDIISSAGGDNAFARAYKAIEAALPEASATGAQVEALLDGIEEFQRTDPREYPAPASSALVSPLSQRERWIAPERELKKTHQNALDIFFYPEGGRSSSERGPVIRSMSPGIVVAAANDWAGGEGAKKYRRGGLTPRAGNGVIIYDPGTRRYYTYFHLRDVSVRPGERVAPGDPLGHGGNTGTTARQRGHGGHLHLEIWDARAGRPLDCYELRDLILSL